MLGKLKENRKIANATHHITAYRIYNSDTKSYLQDCDNDGEAQAGGRLLHLMQVCHSSLNNVIQYLQFAHEALSSQLIEM